MSRRPRPTARYGPRVQGAGIHHNPSPGPAGERFVYGHAWVTLSLPLRALLYVCRKDVPPLAGFAHLFAAVPTWAAIGGYHSPFLPPGAEFWPKRGSPSHRPE